jgi:hypothetical protein
MSDVGFRGSEPAFGCDWCLPRNPTYQLGSGQAPSASQDDLDAGQGYGVQVETVDGLHKGLLAGAAGSGFGGHVPVVAPERGGAGPCKHRSDCNSYPPRRLHIGTPDSSYAGMIPSSKNPTFVNPVCITNSFTGSVQNIAPEYS